MRPSPEREQAERDTLSLTTSSDFHVFPFAKRRISHYCRNVGVEQTDIVVDMGLLKPQWRSISIEGGELDSILKVLKSEVKAESGDDDGRKVPLGECLVGLAGEPCGYPQFVVNLLALI